MKTSWKKFHPLFGNDLRVAVSLEVPIGLEKEIQPADGVGPSETKDLIHRNGSVIRYSLPAVVSGNILFSDTSEIRLVNWLKFGTVSDEFKYGLTLWAKKRENLEIHFGRNGEDGAFSFGYKKYHIHLALQNKLVREFNPLFAKALDKESFTAVSFVVEALVHGEKTLRIRRVEEDEMPPCLQEVIL